MHEVKPETIEYVARKFLNKSFAKQAKQIGQLIYDKLDLQLGQCVHGLQTGNLAAMYRAHVNNNVKLGTAAKSEEDFERTLYIAIDFARD